MPIILDARDISKLKRRSRAGRMQPIKTPAQAQRDMERRLNLLWDRLLLPASERVRQMVRDRVGGAAIAQYLDQVLREVETQYDLAADDIAARWQSSVDERTRIAMQSALQRSLGVDIRAIVDDPTVADALAMGGHEAASLIKTIPGEYLGQVARAVADNFQGVDLPEGRSLLEQIQHLGQVDRKRARLIARDQTSKLTGVLNRTRQNSIGISEYIWRTVKDNRVVGKPGGRYPKPSKAHGNHYERDGKVFRWDSPPPDGHPGWAIQCRCYAEPVVDIRGILKNVQAT